MFGIKRMYYRLRSWFIGKTIVSPRKVDDGFVGSNVYNVAKDELGTREISGSKHNPRVLEYHKEAGGHRTDEVPWCSSFVNWCFKQVGVKGTENASARSWMSWGKKTKEPKKGDVVVFYRGSRRGWKGHVGFYVSDNLTHVLVLGGNQNNSVCYQYFAKNKLLGYRTQK